MRIGADVRAVNILLVQQEDAAVLVLAGRHDASDHIGIVHVIADAQQVLALPDLDVGVLAHPLDGIQVVPVPGQFSADLLQQPAFAQERFHGVCVLKAQIFHALREVRVHLEAVRGLAAINDALRHNGPCGTLHRLVLVDHVVHKVIGQVPGEGRDLGELRHDAVDPERLVPQLPGRHNLAGCGHVGDLRPDKHQVLAAHPAALAIRGNDLKEVRVRGADHLHFLPGLVLGQAG